MAQVKFTPHIEEFVAASPPHPSNSFYRVAIGSEDWDGLQVAVEKVQMVYAGKVAGRKAPSYPADSDDADLVRQALDRIRKRARGDASRARRPVSLVDLIGSAKGLYGTPDDVQIARDELRRKWP